MMCSLYSEGNSQGYTLSQHTTIINLFNIGLN